MLFIASNIKRTLRKMKKLIFLIPIFFLTSCATLMLKKDYNIKVSSNVPNAKAEIQDSVYSLPSEFLIKRSKEDLNIKLFTDSIERNYIVKASPNATFLYYNLICYPILPIMYGIDFTNQKRFYYGKNIALNTNDTTSVIRPKILNGYYNYWTKNYPTNKGQINLILSLPWVNNFYLQPHQETPKANTGFWGISVGLEYYYKEKRYLSLTGSAVMDIVIPFPAPVDFSGEVENIYSVYTSFTDNYKFRRFTAGYGLNYSRNTWKLVYHDRFAPPPPTREPVTKTSSTIGFTFDGYHQVGKSFFVGLIYRPTLLNFNPDIDFKYEHLISLDFKFKIRLKR